MEKKEHWGQLVNRIIVLTLVVLMSSCSGRKTLIKNNDFNLLDVYLYDEGFTSEVDSIFLGSNNSNNYIIEIQKKYLELKKDSFIKMPKKISKKVNGKIEFVNVVKGDSIYNNLLNKPWVTIKIDSLVHNVFSSNEFSNYEKQLVNSNWDESIYKKIEKIYSPSSIGFQKEVIYISKPMFTLDKKYALIYSYKKNINVYPSIKVYEFKNKKWRRVYVIEPREF